MTHKKKHHHKDHEAEQAAPEPDAPVTEPAIDPAPGAASAGVGVMPQPDEELKRLADQLAEARDQGLRLAAEYDNFRKRTARERQELRTRSHAEVVSNILDALDDLGRVAHLDPDKTSAKDIVAGVELAERKMLRELEAAGLERVGKMGDKFDPNAHEAVASTPAASAEADHTIAQVFQPGYKFGGNLLRPARVQVFIWSAPTEPAA